MSTCKGKFVQMCSKFTFKRPQYLVTLRQSGSAFHSLGALHWNDLKPFDLQVINRYNKLHAPKNPAHVITIDLSYICKIKKRH